MAVQCHDARQNTRHFLGRVELARFLAGACRELPNQVLVGVAQRVGIRGKLAEALGNFAQLTSCSFHS